MTGAEVPAGAAVVAKAASAVEAAVADFMQVTGADRPTQELTKSLAQTFYYRRQVRMAKQLVKAAAEIRATGLPAHAVADRTLRSLVEDGSVEEDEEMQDRWANLLAREAVGDATPPAYLRILAEITPGEARALDRLIPVEGIWRGSISDQRLGLTPAQLDNLVRLRLLRETSSFQNRPGGAEGAFTMNDLSRGFKQQIVVTPLAREFVAACRPPRASSERPS